MGTGTLWHWGVSCPASSAHEVKRWVKEFTGRDVKYGEPMLASASPHTSPWPHYLQRTMGSEFSSHTAAKNDLEYVEKQKIMYKTLTGFTAVTAAAAAPVPRSRGKKAAVVAETPPAPAAPAVKATMATAFGMPCAVNTAINFVPPQWLQVMCLCNHSHVPIQMLLRPCRNCCFCCGGYGTP
jgi:hypothetical protein